MVESVDQSLSVLAEPGSSSCLKFVRERKASTRYSEQDVQKLIFTDSLGAPTLHNSG